MKLKIDKKNDQRNHKGEKLWRENLYKILYKRSLQSTMLCCFFHQWQSAINCTSMAYSISIEVPKATTKREEAVRLQQPKPTSTSGLITKLCSHHDNNIMSHSCLFTMSDVFADN